MDNPEPSPRITNVAWGRLEVEGYPAFKDAKLYPGGAREWDWRETGTAHDPGIQPADIAELIEHGATILVLGQGYHGRLLVSLETMLLVSRRKINTYFMPTEAAVRFYNERRENEAVGGLFHTTC